MVLYGILLTILADKFNIKNKRALDRLIEIYAQYHSLLLRAEYLSDEEEVYVNGVIRRKSSGSCGCSSRECCNVCLNFIKLS